MSYTLEPMIQSGDTGQRMLFLTLATVHNMDIHKDGYHMPWTPRGCLHGGRRILEGGITLRWVYMQKFWPVSCPSRRLEKELKMADDKIKNAIWVLLLSLLA